MPVDKQVISDSKPKDTEVPGLLEKAIICIASTCDGAKSSDGRGFNKYDAEFLAPYIQTSKEGKVIATLLRQKVWKRVSRYSKQLAKNGININDVTADEDARKQASGEFDRGLIPKLAQAICEESAFALDQGKKLCSFNNGTYQPDGDSHVNKQVKRWLTEWKLLERWSSRIAREVIEFIRVDSPDLWERPPSDFINVANGLLEIETGKLHPHDHNFLSTVQFPIEYKPSATCPEWDNFLSQAFPEDAMDFVWELIGFLMVPDAPCQKAVLLLGPGGNGKSTFLEGVSAFIGRSNITNISLHKLESDRFSVARLVGKMVNTFADLPGDHLKGTSIFKSITGGDSISGEYKFRDSFEFRPFAKLVFSSNEPPKSYDSSEAFFDRWVVVPFNKTFRDSSVEIPRHILDAKLANSEELSGVLNKALVGLNNLNKNGSFSIPESMEAAFTEFRKTTDPVAIWLDQYTVESPNGYITKAELLSSYNRYAEERGSPSMSSTAFGRSFKKLRPRNEEAQRVVNGTRTWVWSGLAFEGIQSDESKEEKSLDSLGLSVYTPDENDTFLTEEIKPVMEDISKENRVNRVNQVKNPSEDFDGFDVGHASDPWDTFIKDVTDGVTGRQN